MPCLSKSLLISSQSTLQTTVKTVLFTKDEETKAQRWNNLPKTTEKGVTQTGIVLSLSTLLCLLMDAASHNSLGKAY